jgi:hypothetical protein
VPRPAAASWPASDAGDVVDAAFFGDVEELGLGRVRVGLG